VDVRQAKALLASGQSLRQISKSMGLAVATLHRHISTTNGHRPAPAGRHEVAS
jgi:lambda repressor-like predicted transcriptional regulator